MAGVDHTCCNFKLVACSSRRKMENSILPEEIIFNILLWLPAEVLYNVMRYVCREWYNVINDPDFINAHLQKSTGGILIQSCNTTTSVYSVQIHNCDVQIRELGPEFPLHVYASCDGLVFSYCIYRRIYSVLNPITNQLVNLPPFYKTWCINCHEISYVRSIGRYKVMFIIRDENNLDDCLISTVGADNAWRQIDIKHLPDFGNYLLCCDTFSTGGYIYVTRDGARHLFALDAEAEIFHQFNVPNVCLTAIRATYVVWKSYLSLLAHCGEFVWELWALTELSRGEWTRILSIDLRSQRCMIERLFSNDLRRHRCLVERIYSYDLRRQRCILDQISDVLKSELSLDRRLVPIAFIKNGELVIFRGVDPFKTYFVYNLQTRKILSFEVGFYDRHISNGYICHVNSLVSLTVS